MIGKFLSINPYKTEVMLDGGDSGGRGRRRKMMTAATTTTTTAKTIKGN